MFDNLIKLVKCFFVLFVNLVFDWFVFGEGWWLVVSFWLLDGRGELFDCFLFVGDILCEYEIGEEGWEFGCDEGFEEGFDWELYNVVKVVGWEWFRFGVVGLDWMFGDLFIGGLFGEDLLFVLCFMFVFKVFRLRDDFENFFRWIFGLKLDVILGLMLFVWFDLWFECFDCEWFLWLEMLLLILDFCIFLFCLVRCFVIFWNFEGKWLYVLILWVFVLEFIFFGGFILLEGICW